MLQISGVLEIRSHQLRRDALKLMNATLCGTATTEFWRLMESYFGVDEDLEEAALEDAQSLAEIMAQKKAWVEENVPSVSKETSEAIPEVVIDDDDDEADMETASVQTSHSASSSTSLKTLAAKKHTTIQKYPSACNIKSAQLFYPTSSDTLHSTGVYPDYVTDRKKIGPYKGYYCCNYGDCQYAGQTHGVVCTHVRRVHLGHALGCRFCPTLSWWQARYWSDHMDRAHSNQPKYEALSLPENPEGIVKAEEVVAGDIPEEDHFIIRESWSYPPTQQPVPVHKAESAPQMETPLVHKSAKKRKFTGSDLEELFEDQ